MKTNNITTTFLAVFFMVTFFYSCKKAELINEVELSLEGHGCESWIVPNELQEDDDLHPTYYKARLCEGGTAEGRITKDKEIILCVKKSNITEGSSRSNILTVIGGYAGVIYMPLSSKFNPKGVCQGISGK